MGHGSDMYAKKKKKRSAASNGNLRFINHDLSMDDKDWLAAADLEKEFPPELVFDLVTDGYKLTMREDEKNECFLVSLIDHRVEEGADHLCLSGRGGNVLDAWHALAYRHFHLGQGSWAVLLPTPTEGTGRYG